MTADEHNDILYKQQWGDWVLGIVLKALEGSGLRPSVEYLPPEYKKNMEGKTELVKPERYRFVITLPLEWRVTSILKGDDICVSKVVEIASEVKYFKENAWSDGMVSDYHLDMFFRLPGHFDFLTEKTPEILYRITMCNMCNTIGKRNIRSIDLYDDFLIIHTRRGSWRIEYDNYRKRLATVMKRMRPFMRRPIRNAYLREIRQRKHDKKEN